MVEARMVDSATARASDLEVGDDFAVDVWWAGAQDKPYYRAALVSESRRDAVVPAAFRGVAVIDREELRRVLDALDRHGVARGVALATDMADEYRIVVASGDDRRTGRFDGGGRAAEVLGAIRDALAPGHRRPLHDMLRRLAPGAEVTR
jgi:hypothetical protein